MFIIKCRVYNEEYEWTLKNKACTLYDAINLCKLHMKLMYYENGLTKVTFSIYQDSVFIREITLNIDDVKNI